MLKETQEVSTYTFHTDCKFSELKWTVVGKPQISKETKMKEVEKEKSQWNLASDPNMLHVNKAAEEIAKLTEKKDAKAKAIQANIARLISEEKEII